MKEPEAIVGGDTGAVPNSVQFVCVQCKGVAWLSPSGQRAREARNLPVLCIRCGLSMMSKDDDLEIHIAPGAVEEFIESLQRHTEKN